MGSRLFVVGAGVFSACACASNQATTRVAGPAPASAAPRVEACAPLPPPRASAYALRYDQLGYLPGREAWAVVVSAGAPPPGYRVVDVASGCTVAAGTAGPRVLDERSRAGTPMTGDLVDLSRVNRPGRYMVVTGDGGELGPVVVGGDVYAQALEGAVAFLREQRCGPTTREASLHGPCHLHASVARASSGDAIAVDDGYRGAVTAASGPSVDVEGGWHDAGDYIKFVGTSAFVLAVDLLALRDHAAALATPAAGGVREGLRAEMRWGLDWLVKMLGSGTLYHQVSGARDHDRPWRRPEADTTAPVPGYAERPVFRFRDGAGANLLGRSAAALALGAQVFADDAAYAAGLLALARKVYAAGKARPKPQEPDPPDFYAEDTVEDDLALGAALLAQATGERAFAEEALAHARKIEVPDAASPLDWSDVSSLAFLETALAEAEGSQARAEMSGALGRLAAPIAASAREPRGPGAAFRYALPSFGDGSVAESLGAAAVCLAARRLGLAPACAEVARAQLDWLFGQNPFGVSFMVGAGAAYPRAIHHAFGRAASVELPGAIVGGPSTMVELDRRRAKDRSLTLPGASGPFAAWSTDDLVYDDTPFDYVTNEPAIDFGAPLVFVLAELLDPT
jgi:endoglucanase